MKVKGPGVAGPGVSGPGSKKSTRKRPVKKAEVPEKDMKPFFWTKIPDKKIDNTIFEGIDDEGVEVAGSQLVELFSREAAPAATDKDKGSASSKPSGKPKMVSVLDGKRQQNCGIAVARVRLTFAQLKEAAFAMDSAKLGSELCGVLGSLMPTSEEAIMLQDAIANKAPDAKMPKLDMFMYQLSTLPQLQGRLSCLGTMRAFDTAIPKIGEGLGTVQAAVREVACSPAFLELLRLVLKLGNYMNASTSRGSAYGFKLDSLAKMASIKSNDPSRTLMHFLAEHLCSLTAASADEYKLRPLPTVEGGDADPLKAVLKMDKVPPMALSKCTPSLADLSQAAGGEGLSLLAAVLRSLGIVRAVGDASLGNLAGDAEQLRAALKATSKVVDSVQAARKAGGHPAEDKLPEVVQPFVEDAEEALGSVFKQVSSLRALLVAVVRGYGEDPKKMDSDGFFAILADFGRKLQRGAREVAELRKKEDKGGGSGGTAAAAASASGKKTTPKRGPGPAGGMGAALAAQAAMAAAKRK